jgi:iron complex transport system substrate-binding protein
MEEPMHRTPLEPSRRVVTAAVILILLTGCGSGDGAASPDDASTRAPATETPSAAGGTFPVTIEHAFGETVVDKEPTRVLTWGWGSTDAAVALDVVPVAMPFQEYGGDDEGVLPWVRRALQEGGAALPEVLPNTDEPPFEAIAAARPDLILAVYSGITENDYRLLSQIAPTVAYPDQPWATPWRDTIEIVGTALGRPDAAEQVLDDIDTAVAEQASIGEEQVPQLTSDILVSYADTQAEADTFLDSPTAKLMDQVERGAVAQVVGSDFIAAVSPPTALSLTWGLDEYVRLLSEAAQADDASS